MRQESFLKSLSIIKIISTDVIDKNVKSHNDDLFNQRYRNSSSTDSIPKSVPNLQESPKEVKRESEPKALLSNDPKGTILIK